MKIKDIEKTGKITLLVKSVEEKQTKANKPYWVMQLTDGDKDISANIWDIENLEEPAKGNIIDCELEVGTYNGQASYTVRNIVRNNTAKISDYVQCAPLSANQMYSEMVEVIQGFKDPELLRITGNILQDNREKLKTWGAAKSVHHNIVTGLLYHMYRMMKSAIALAEIYPVNRDMLIAGVLLHDIGKIYELETDELGNSTYTVDGNLFGHLYIGAEIVSTYGKKFDTNPEIIRNLKHIILSHHGKLEWEAVKVPCTIEAALVSELDMIDAKMYQFEKIGKDMEPGTMNDQRIYSLDGAHIYVPNL